MKYPRPKYLDPSVKTTTGKTIFCAESITVPLFDTPIPRRENFFKAAKRDGPAWVPIYVSDIQSLMINELADERPGIQLGPRFSDIPSDYTFLDMFGNSWTWVALVGGAMLTPGTRVLEDICDWEKVIKFPCFDDWNYRETAEKFMRDKYDPEKVMHINLHQGLTEMLVAFLGGYEDAMTALILEPEAVSDFFAAFAKFMIDFFDFLNSMYPIDFVTYHDDWGTERDTFFSEKTMEELVFEPTSKIISHIKGKGVVFELHSCGKIERFLPYACDLGVDFLQMQRRANDMPALKEKYGDRIGFNAPFEGLEPGVEYSDEELVEAVRKTVDIYAPGGGLYPFIAPRSEPERVWKLATELYYYSREFYEKLLLI